jgi:hypothetical protein
MKQTFMSLLICGSVLTSGPILARDLSVEITNLTNATYFTPLLVAAHDTQTDLFELGQAASAQLQAMAEGGDISGLIDDVVAGDGEYVTNPAAGLLAPGQSTQARLDLRGFKTSRLSIVAMLLPTNDGFVGLDSLKIPREVGTYTYYLNGYDAGTEANDEIITGGGAPGVPGIPADPGGNSGTGGVSEVDPDFNPTVHVHRGIVGDMDPTGGTSDLDSRVHRWHNPVARITLRVIPDGRPHRE